jgi:hypothetical protein
MSKEQIKEFPPNSFKSVEQFDKLAWQDLMFVQRDDANRLRKWTILGANRRITPRALR